MRSFIGCTLEELLSTYTRAKSLYYYGNNTHSFITDQEFDQLEAMIRNISPGNPLLKAGAPIPLGSPLKKISHRIFMGSISNSMRLEEAAAFWKRHDGMPVVAALKVDGLSLDLQYDRGQLSHAITRGDCINGEDVTHNALQVNSVRPNCKSVNNIRGEMVLTYKNYKELKTRYPDYKSPRNLASGLLRRKELSSATKRLTFIAHWLYHEEELTTYSDMLGKLLSMNYFVPDHIVCHTFQEVVRFYQNTEELRSNNGLNYEIDGIVLTINDLKYFDDQGIDSELCPRAQTAWKFKSQSAITTLNSIEVNVSQHGKLCPVGIVEPIQLGGVTISRVTLNNYQFIQDMGLKIEDEVIIARQGDVIPGIIGISKPCLMARGNLIIEPSTCPVCDGLVKRQVLGDGSVGTESFCQNPYCDAKTTGKVRRWIKTHNMRGFGDEILDALMNVQLTRHGNEMLMTTSTNGGKVPQPLIASVADLFKLKQWPLEIIAEIKMGSGVSIGANRMDQVVTEIERSKITTIEKFIDGLGIKNLGERMVAKIRKAWIEVNGDHGYDPQLLDHPLGWMTDPRFGSKLIELKDQLGIPGIAEAFQQGLDSMKGVVNQLLDAGVQVIVPEEPKVIAGPLNGMVFCLTGDFPSKKSQIEKEIQDHGGAVEGDVKSNVTCVVMSTILPADQLTGKGQKAVKKGLPIISLNDLREIINGSKTFEAYHKAMGT